MAIQFANNGCPEKFALVGKIIIQYLIIIIQYNIIIL